MAMIKRGEIVITPTIAEADQLNGDLEILREHGAESNTEAVLKAVSEAAERVRQEPRHEEES